MTKVHITVEKFTSDAKDPYVKSGLGIRVTLPEKIVETKHNDAIEYLESLKESFAALLHHEEIKFLNAKIISEEEMTTISMEPVEAQMV